MELAGVLWDAANRLFRRAKAQAGYVLKLEENVTSLQRKWDQLERIQKDVEAKIEDAEMMGDTEGTNEAKGWLKDVEDLHKVYMAEIRDDQGGSQENGNKCLSGYSPRKCMSRYKLGKKVVKMISEVDDLLKRRERFDKDVGMTHKPRLKVMDDEMPCGETVGMDPMLNNVWSSLQDQSVGIIGLYGMGGAGKTTLLKRIHSELGKREHRFDLVLWVVVSKDCDIGKVMNEIRNRLGIKDEDWSKSSEDQRVAKIYRVLKRKTFMLMLDDLWGKLELERVGVPHPKKTNYKSKVLLTTRSEDVCDKMQAENKFKVECLHVEEAFDLFCKKVGEKTLRSHREIPKIAREMSKKCGGLPLAIITVGSAMAGVKSVEAWRQAKCDLSTSPWTALDLQDNVFRILEFSYYKLPDEAHKNCFLYCALYPEDYVIKVEDLIDRWIGEGFLAKSGKCKSIYDMREEGKSIIDKLKLSCLLEDATNLDNFLAHSIKMHDVIRDMALWLARARDENKDKIVVEEEAFALDSERLNVVEKISAINVSEDWQVPNCPNLLTLSLRVGWRRTIDFSKLQFCTRLRLLDLRESSITHIPVEIGRLTNLEFLNISGTRMREKLPSEMKNLEKLRVLLMEGAVESLDKLPLEVLESLKQLKVFRYSGRRVEEEENEEMLVNRLESLPELEELGIFLRTMGGLNKLLKSTKLQGCVRFLKLFGIRDPIEMACLLTSRSGMKHLESIYLDQLPKMMEVSSSIVTTTWQLSNLRDVTIQDCDSITHLTWLRYAPLLETLAVVNCKSMEEVLRPGSDDEDLFSNLRRLLLVALNELKSIHNRALPFPSLKYFSIGLCPKLTRLPLNSNSAKDALIEIYTDIEWWNSLEWDNQATKDLFQSKLLQYY